MVDSPNIVFVLPDQLAARWTSVDGHPIVKTPRLEEFAKTATNFTQAYSTSPLCTPYRGCLFTGLYPAQTGVLDNGDMLPTRLPTIATHLNESGYNTYYYGKWHLSGQPYTGYRQVPRGRQGGFQHFVGWECGTGPGRYERKVWGRKPKGKLLQGHETDGLTDLVIEGLSEGLPEPFCLFISYHAPHAPSEPPQEYLDLYQGQDLLHEPNVVDPSKRFKAFGQNLDVQAFREHYFGDITHVDAAFGRLLDKIDALSLADRTAIVFTSDHGEMAGSHGKYKKRVMFDESARVPLLIRLPGQQQASTTDYPVSTIDLLPTLLDVAEVEVPPDGPGQSMVPAMRGEDVQTRPVFLDFNTRLCVVDRKMKLVMQKKRRKPTELYNLVEDPYELNNLLDVDDYQAEVDRLTRLLRRWLRQVEPV